MAMKTLDLKSYKIIVPGKLSFDVWDMKAEEDGGSMKLFATVKVPVNVDAVNHVWQVGATVMPGGFIAPHDFKPPNLNSKGRLSLNGSNDSGVVPVDPITQKKNVRFILALFFYKFYVLVLYLVNGCFLVSILIFVDRVIRSSILKFINICVQPFD
jgi:hypothetical protein